MSEESKYKVSRSLGEAFTEGDNEVVDETTLVCYDPNSEAGKIMGAKTTKGEIEYFHSVFPDFGYHVEDDQIAEGDKVATEYDLLGAMRQRGAIHCRPQAKSPSGVSN